MQDWEEFIHEGINAAMASQSPRQSFHPQLQVLLDRQLRDDLTTLGYIADSCPRPLMGWLPIKPSTVEDKLATAGPQQTD